MLQAMDSVLLAPSSRRPEYFLNPYRLPIVAAHQAALELVQMNMNSKIIKVLAAFVVIIGTVFWAINSIRPRSYNGTELNFEVKSGSVLVTNSSSQSIPVQFIGTGTRAFRVSSDIEGISGNSTREGSGRSAIQLFAFELPAGTSEFTIARGSGVTFVATAPTELEATMHPMTTSSFRAVIIGTVVVVLGALFYASNVMEHSWLRLLRGENAMTQDTRRNPVVTPGDQGEIRSFGDNRTPHQSGSPANAGD
jgi:hypothetical protein